MKHVLTSALLALSLVSTPAFAMTRRPSVPIPMTPQNTYEAERVALNAEYTAFTTCASAKPGYWTAKSAGEFGAAEVALNTATSAAANGAYSTYVSEAATFHNLLAGLKAKWGC